MRNKLILIVFILIFKQSLQNKVCPGFENGKSQEIPPKLKFSTLLYPYNNYFNQSLAKDSNSNELLINVTKSLSPLHLDCWANYPIDFKFLGHMTNERGQVRISRKGECYHINVTLLPTKEVTGNYSCFSLQNETLMSWKYLYVYSPPPSILLLSGENVKLRIQPGQKKVILPCAISNPEFSEDVQLLRVQGNNTELVLQSNSLRYGPTLGFEMTLSENINTALGDYRCQLDTLDKVDITLTGPRDWTIVPKSRKIDLKLGEFLQVLCLSKYDDVTIQTTPEIELKMNSNEIDLSYYVKFGGGRSHIFNKSGSGFVECLRSRDNQTLHRWSYQVRNETKSVGLLDHRRIVNHCPNRIRSGKSESSVILYECNNLVECRMSQCLRNDATCVPNNLCVKGLCIPNGIIQCPTEDGVISEIFFSGFNGKRYTNSEYASTSDVLRIVKENSTKDSYFKLRCEGSHFVFSAGFIWHLYLNGKDPIAINGTDQIRINEQWGTSKSVLVSILSFPISISKTLAGAQNQNEGSKNFVYCSAPIWNSTDWMSQKFQIDDEIMLGLKSSMKEKRTGNGACFLSSNFYIIWLCFVLFRLTE